MMKQVKKELLKKGQRKGFTMIELIFVLVLIGVLVSTQFTDLNDEEKKADFTNAQKDILINIHKGITEWTSHRYDKDGTTSTLSPTVAAVFFPDFNLVDGKLVPKDLPEAKIDFLAAKSSTGRLNSTYKILFDYSEVKSKLDWSDEEATQEEHRMASYYKGLASTSVIAGQATSLGAANVDLVESAPNSDAIIAMTYAR